MNKLKAFWASLPHQVQAVAITFGAAAMGTFVHAISDSECYTASCLKHYAATALSSGLVALRVFYMMPSNNQPQPPVTPQPK